MTEINTTQKFYQKNALAIFNTGTIFLNLYFLVTITNMINRKVANKSIPIPKAKIDLCQINFA